MHREGRGSAYASADDRRPLERAGAVAIRGRKGDCWDDVVAESFFATLNTEALHDQVPDGHDAATRAIRRCIDGEDDTQRRHSFIGSQSPVQFE